MNQNREFTLMLNNFAANCPFSFSNLMMQSPLRYSMMERRFLYKLAEEIKRRYTQMGLSSRDNWKNFVFRMTNNDLACLGGKSNWKRTYKVIRQLAERTVIQFKENEKGQLILAHYHWIDAFNWNADTNDYTVRVSPDLYNYVINLTRKFTVLDLHTAIRLASKYTQKFYEFCCQYCGDYRFVDPENPTMFYKQRVVKIDLTAFRFMFGLSELRDPVTGEVVAKSKYQRFKELQKYVIAPAQQELYEFYKDFRCNVWFDYYATDRINAKSAPTTLYFFIYSKEHPKSKDSHLDRPWKEGDMPLIPFEEKKPRQKKLERRINVRDWSKMDAPQQREVIEKFLAAYLKPEEADYYLDKIDDSQRMFPDSYAQILQVIYEKQRQEKFAKGTRAYKRKCLVDFVFRKNLENYGWSIPPMKTTKAPKVSELK